jgi:hypothetical protein
VNTYVSTGTKWHWHTLEVGVRTDCRHYSTRSQDDEVIQRCRLEVNEPTPFACPDGCLFFEPRKISNAGWQQAEPGDES